jgi:hypothetical protein
VFPGTPSTAEALIEVSATLIHDNLKDQARQGVIAIGLSYNVVFELLQDPRQFAHAIELGRGSFVERKLARRLQAVRP